MRHGKKFNKLGRESSHRNAMLSNLAVSIIAEKRIFTTLAKAKELKKFVEPLITKAKAPTQHNRRLVYGKLRNNKEAVQELFDRVGPKSMDRPGGYTRIIRTGKRLGDNAEMCMIELVDYNDAMLESATKTTRRGRKKNKSIDDTTSNETVAVENEEGSAEEVVEETKTTEEVEASADTDNEENTKKEE